MFDKVKAAAIVFLAAAIAGIAGAVSDYDFGSWGVWGPAAGAGLAALVAYLRTEVTGYGQGVPKDGGQ